MGGGKTTHNGHCWSCTRRPGRRTGLRLHRLWHNHPRKLVLKRCQHSQDTRSCEGGKTAWYYHLQKARTEVVRDKFSLHQRARNSKSITNDSINDLFTHLTGLLRPTTFPLAFIEEASINWTSVHSDYFGWRLLGQCTVITHRKTEPRGPEGFD